MPKLTNTQHLYVRSMGKMLRVTAVFPDDDSCNEWLAKNRDHGVVAVMEGIVFTAELHDKGTTSPEVPA